MVNLIKINKALKKCEIVHINFIESENINQLSRQNLL